MDDKLTEILILATARHILLDWKGIKDEKEKDIKYSEQNAVALLTKYPDFRDIVADLANDSSLFKEEEEKEIVKNSKT